MNCIRSSSFCRPNPLKTCVRVLATRRCNGLRRLNPSPFRFLKTSAVGNRSQVVTFVKSKAIMEATAAVVTCDERKGNAEKPRVSHGRQEISGMGWKYPYEYDVGIYWYSKGNKCARHSVRQQCPKCENDDAKKEKPKRLWDCPDCEWYIDKEYFDPSKPTMIFLHGWEAGMTYIGWRETFNWYHNFPQHSSSPDDNYADAWIDAGYNMGIFYWSEFADETLVHFVESKIWSTDGWQGIRYCLKDKESGTLKYYNKTKGEKFPDGMDVCSVSEMFVANYKRLFKKSLYSGENVRLVGHSTGSQLAVHSASLLHEQSGEDNDHYVLPTRIALVDVYFTRFGKSFLDNKSTGQKVLESARYLIQKRGVLLEQYQSSMLNDMWYIGDTNMELRSLAGVFVALQLPEVHPLNLQGRHVAGSNQYFYFLRERDDASETHGKVSLIGTKPATSALSSFASYASQLCRWATSSTSDDPKVVGVTSGSLDNNNNIKSTPDHIYMPPTDEELRTFMQSPISLVQISKNKFKYVQEREIVDPQAVAAVQAAKDLKEQKREERSLSPSPSPIDQPTDKLAAEKPLHADTNTLELGATLPHNEEELLKIVPGS